MYSSNCCFSTCKQFSQEAGKVVWYSHLLKNFPVCHDPHSQRLWHSNEAEVDVFLELSFFYDDTTDIGNLSLVLRRFLNSAWTSRISLCTQCWNFTWINLNITLLAYEMSAIVQLFEDSLALPFFGIGMKTDLFQSCGHCWVFQICWHIECSTFTASFFRIWSGLAGIPSSPLALFAVILSKANLT